MARKWIILHLLCTFILSVQSCQKADHSAEKQPNIIIFFTDDQGYGDVGCYGAEGFETPHLDNLAKQGVRFTDFYVAASVCTPSRAALLTGKYPKQLGLHEAVIFPYSTHGLSPDEITLPELLKPLGYTTAVIGKWHLGNEEKFLPNNQGFDYYYGVPYSNDMDAYYYKHNKFQSPPLPVYENMNLIEEGPNQDNLTRMWTDAAVDYINKNKDRPFFLYVAHNMPHTPWHASEDFRGSSTLGLYGDIIQELDWSIGQITNTLHQHGIENNTLIIYTSDNGPVTRLKNGGSAGVLRGSKATTWEGGMRVPGIISWPAKIPLGATCTQPVSTMDLLPTIVALAGGEMPSSINTHGRDIQKLLFDPMKPDDDIFELMYYGRNGELEALRQGDWKLHIAKSIGWPKKGVEFPVSLYNLKDDIGEATNIAEAHPDIVEKLTIKMKSIDNEISNQLPTNE